MLESAITTLLQMAIQSNEDAKEDRRIVADALNNLADAMRMPKEQSAGDLLEQFSQMKAHEALLSVENRLESDLPALPKVQMVALPSKNELAKEWLREHPEDALLTGRELSNSRFPHGVAISHVSWNKAKSEV